MEKRKPASSRLAQIPDATGVLAEAIKSARAAHPGAEVITADQAPEVGAALLTQLELERIAEDAKKPL